MQLTPELLFLGIVINRLTELGKQAFLPDEGISPRLERARPFIILFTSFLLGAAAVAVAFPASDLFPNASYPIWGQIATGVFVGAIANGVDFAAGLGESVAQRVKPAA